MARPFFLATSRRALLGTIPAVAPWPGLPALAEEDPLPSWNDGAAKQIIIAFVHDTTTEGSPVFVAPEDRIATFDQDGTTRVEHPLYGQGLFAVRRRPKANRGSAASPTSSFCSIDGIC